MKVFGRPGREKCAVLNYFSGTSIPYTLRSRGRLKNRTTPATPDRDIVPENNFRTIRRGRLIVYCRPQRRAGASKKIPENKLSPSVVGRGLPKQFQKKYRLQRQARAPKKFRYIPETPRSVAARKDLKKGAKPTDFRGDDFRNFRWKRRNRLILCSRRPHKGGLAALALRSPPRGFASLAIRILRKLRK